MLRHQRPTDMERARGECSADDERARCGCRILKRLLFAGYHNLQLISPCYDQLMMLALSNQNRLLLVDACYVRLTYLCPLTDLHLSLLGA